MALALSLCVTTAFRAERTEALFPALVAYGTLEVVLISSGLAAAAGIITLQQNRAFKAQVSALTQRLSEATGDAISSIASQVKELYKNYMASVKKTGPTTKPTSPAKDADCKAGINDDPRKCCDNWFKRSENIENAPGLGYILAQTARKAFQIFSSDGGNIRCCLEWDATHARFEVYVPGGNGQYQNGGSGDAYTHKGEFSCVGGSGDPCKATHPDKADNSGPHAPRDGCKTGMSSPRGASGVSPADAAR